MTAVIVDDEPLARADLRQLLADQGVQVLGEAETAAEAIQQAETLQPDVLFLDVRMPGVSGLQMTRAMLHLEKMPLLIFVTGYSEHALDAFERNALDYLLKPVLPERLMLALARARERLEEKQARHAAQQPLEQSLAQTPPLRRLPVRTDFSVRFVDVDAILFAVARNKRVYIRTQEEEHRTYYTLKQLEGLLPQDRFLRIHDSYVVNLDLVVELLFLGDHTYEVRLTNDQRVPVSRTRYPELQKHLGG